MKGPQGTTTSELRPRTDARRGRRPPRGRNFVLSDRRDGPRTIRARTVAVSRRDPGGELAIPEDGGQLLEFPARVLGHDVSLFIADLAPVVAYVLDAEFGVVVARRQADEEAGYDAAGGRVHLAADVDLVRGEPAHKGGDQLGVELLTQFRPEELFRHAGEGHRGDGVGLDVVPAALDGQDPGEPDQAHLGRTVVGLAEVAQDA